MLTLLMAVTGGNDWEGYFTPLMQVNVIAAICFLVYICMMLFGILNVITGIFVEGANQNAKADTEQMNQQAFHKVEATANILKKVLRNMDLEHGGNESGLGKLSLREFRDHAK